MKKIFIFLIVTTLFSLSSCSNPISSKISQFSNNKSAQNDSKANANDNRVSSVAKTDLENLEFTSNSTEEFCEETFAKVVGSECHNVELTSVTVFPSYEDASNIFHINSILTIDNNTSRKKNLKKIQEYSTAISTKINADIPDVSELHLSWLINDDNTYGNFYYKKIDNMLSLVEVSLDNRLDSNNDNTNVNKDSNTNDNQPQ